MDTERPSLDTSTSSLLTPTISNPDSDSSTTQPRLKSRNNSHSLSSSATSATSRKSRYADVVPTDTNAGANISMPPPSLRPNTKTRTSSTYSTRTPSAAEILRQGLSASRRASRDDIAVEDFDTPRAASSITMSDEARGSDVTLTNRSRPSMSEGEGKRMSVSSIYSMNSARGIGAQVSAPSSTNGSDAGTKPRTASGALSPTKSIFTAQPETATSTVQVTTSSSSNTAAGLNGLQLTPRETASSGETSKTSTAQVSGAVTPAAREEGVVRPPAPGRDRSRAKRRFSNSTGQSSHSPSSERAAVPAEKKPAPWGVIGVCALDVKARSKPSRNILSRIMAKQEFDLIVFGDKVILDEEVENWPVCDFLISFYSDGFPLDKAIAYVNLRKPFCVNDLPMQKIIWDRRSVLWILDKINVPTPTRLEVSRDGGPNLTSPELAAYVQNTAGVELGTWPKIEAPQTVELSEDGDTLIVDGQTLTKPFVEKPVSGEDHNICVYYPKSQGGGARKLFRKIGNKSSEWFEEMNVPRAITEPEGSYLYEKFMKVENAEDVKAYTVGSGFCHAETRKSPVVDGLVRRNNHGKEIRYVTSLSAEEKAMASRIASTFGQRVCGFDLLRTYEGKSFVIDVNGWSFVKDNEEYYDQCARIMKEMFISEKQRQMSSTGTILSPTLPDPSASLGKATAPREETQPHRSALQSLLSKSPSLSKLHAVHQAHKENYKASPPASRSSTPRHSPTGSNKGVPMPDVPPVPALPPPILSPVSASAPPTVPATPGLNGPINSEILTEAAPVPAPKHSWKLKGMVAVIRHADRTPKQKYKFTFHTKPFIELLKGHQEEVLLTGEAALESVMVAVEQAAIEGVEDREKLRTLRNVLVKKGGWAGTKVQIKPMFRKRKSDDKAAKGSKDKSTDSPTKTDTETKDKERPDPIGRTQRQDSVSDTTLSRITAIEESLVLDKLQLIVKWGGEPTHSARYQAQELGENMRNDLLLMNRELLDEVHVFSSSERRVTTSAQIWASAFTDRKELPPDFITVRKDLLDDSNAAKDEMDKVKKKLKTLLRQGVEAPPQFAWPSNMPEPSIVQRYVVQLMKFHRRVMRHNYGELYGTASSSLNAIANPGEKERSGSLAQATRLNEAQKRWCCGEDAELFKERWEKLFSEFCDSEKVDPSKISELYDTMKFDALHNRPFLEFIFTPSQHILDEEEQAIIEESKGIEKEKQQPKTEDDDSQAQVEKSESSKSLHRRMFRRRSVMAASRMADETAEPHFRLLTGNNQTKAKTDAKLGKLRELYKLAKVLFDFICPQEYGIADHEKLEIGLLTSLPLLKEIVQDLEEMQSSSDAKSFVYFTKESHVYTLLNCILEGGIETKIKRAAIPELDYLSQICFELYESEDKSIPLEANGGLPTNNYSIRITISPGCHLLDPLDIQLDSKHCISCAPRRSLTSHGDWKNVIETLRAKFHQVKLPKSFLAVNLSENHTFHKKDDSSNEEPKDKITTAEELTQEPLPIASSDTNNLLPLPVAKEVTPTGSKSNSLDVGRVNNDGHHDVPASAGNNTQDA